MNKNPRFPATRWTLIAHASNPALAREALTDLFQLYWYPVYAAVRRKETCLEDAENLTQSFFLYACEHAILQRADRSKGRFRTFLTNCLTHFLTDDYRARTADKRGGPEKPVSFDAIAAEARYVLEPVDHRTPDVVFEHKFALEVLKVAMKDLEDEAIADGKGRIFEAIRGYINREDDVESYAAIASRLNIPPGTLRSLAHDWRQALRRIVRERVGDTLAGEDHVDSELVSLEEAATRRTGRAVAMRLQGPANMEGSGRA